MLLQREGHTEGNDSASSQQIRRSPRAKSTSRNCLRENAGEDERGEGKPESFTCLGFQHICAENSRGRFEVRRSTDGERARYWFHALGQRSQRRPTWERLGQVFDQWLPVPNVVHDFPDAFPRQPPCGGISEVRTVCGSAASTGLCGGAGNGHPYRDGQEGHYTLGPLRPTHVAQAARPAEPRFISALVPFPIRSDAWGFHTDSSASGFSISSATLFAGSGAAH